jgi:type IV pilus assembly protein PilA
VFSAARNGVDNRRAISYRSGRSNTAMTATLRKRLRREESGFTLIELLVVIIILGILLAIAVPSYLGFRQRATDSSLKADIRAAVPSAEAYYGDNGSYTGMTVAAMKSYDAGLSPALTVASVTASTYCLAATSGSTSWSIAGPGANFSTGWKNNATCT